VRLANYIKTQLLDPATSDINGYIMFIDDGGHEVLGVTYFDIAFCCGQHDTDFLKAQLPKHWHDCFDEQIMLYQMFALFQRNGIVSARFMLDIMTNDIDGVIAETSKLVMFDHPISSTGQLFVEFDQMPLAVLAASDVRCWPDRVTICNSDGKQYLTSDYDLVKSYHAN
jgi:hypothetical protein